ncbi:hypothetical protein [Sediminibacillus massiliensis]|uniref:hypothetical protein n=1 Tax=Sediminibacillus massiliensis TaxID=1926277 RepID=UPI00098886A8|nr:hypothetical protein [Sediminibacillus massiliensis]
MDFYLAGFIFWTLVIIGSILFLFGLWKKSQKALIISGFTFLFPMLYFIGAENWYRLLALTPIVPFVLAYFTKKNIKNV